MLMLGELGQTAVPSIAAMVYLAIFVLSLILFIVRERRVTTPLLDISVFRVRRFTLTGLSMIMFFMSMNMVTILGPFYYEGVLDYGPEQIGLIFMVLPTVTMFGSPIVGRMYDREPSRPYAAAGHAVRVFSFLLMAYSFLNLNVLLSVVGFFFMGIGSSLFQAPNNSDMMLSLPREKSGVASSLQATIRNLSMSMGVSLATILMTFMMGSMDYGAIAGGPLAGELASSVSIAVVVGGALSLIGVVISRMGERATEEEALSAQTAS